MANESFRPERRKITHDDIERNPEAGQTIREAAAQDELHGDDDSPQAPRLNPEPGVKLEGKVPTAFLEALRQKQRSGNAPPVHSGRERQKPQAPAMAGASSELSSLLEGLREQQTLHEAIELPSKGRFYNGEDGPTDGILHIRAMTGEEEQILATPRFVRKGVAINMIFQRCMQEKYRAEELLTIDRTYLLIWLRGISYTPDYDVEVKCPECEKKFSTVIDLNSLFVDQCPDDYGPELEDTLPKSGFRFSYRLSKGRDEQDIQEYRDRRIKIFGDSSADDTLTYRTALLLESIEGVTDKRELQTLVKNLPIQDVAHIRNCVNEPPFGVDTAVPINCPSCLQEFEVDLPLEANFFFPRRKKKEKNQA